MQFLTEEIDLVCKENFGSLELAQVEALGSELIWRRHQGVDVLCYVFAEFVAMFDQGL